MTNLSPVEKYEVHQPAFLLEHPTAIFSEDPKVIAIRESGHIIGFDCSWRTIYFDPENTTLINGIFEQVQGTVTVQGIAEQLSLPVTHIASVLQTLYELGIVTLKTGHSMGALAFYHHVTNRMRAYRYRVISENPIVIDGHPSNLSRRKLLGFLIESYHFVKSASNHISTAISVARSHRIRQHFTQYLLEEYQHDKLLKDGLLRAGISEDALDQAVPSFPLLGMIHFLRYLAETDQQAYGLCLAISEGHTSPNVTDLHRAEVWEKIKSLRLLPDDTLDAFLDHDILDFHAKHDLIPKILFEDNELLSPNRQRELLKKVTRYIDMVRYAYTYLQSLYQNPDGDPWISIKIP